MKATLLSLLVYVLTFLSGCQGLSRREGSFTFRNLEISYPEGIVLSQVQEVPEKDFVSFFLSDKTDKESRIDFGISELPERFLDTVPLEELLGELAAEVDEMEKKIASSTGALVVEKSEIQWSEPPSFPEAFSFSKIQEGEKVFFVSISAKVVGNYSVFSVSRSGDPSTLERFNSILDNIKSI